MLPVSDNRFAYVRNEWTAIWTKALPSPKAPLSTTMTCMKLRRNRWPSKRWTTVAKKHLCDLGIDFSKLTVDDIVFAMRVEGEHGRG